MADQEILLAEYPTRLRYSPDMIQPHLADFKPEELTRRVGEDFYNPLVLEVATSVLYSIFAASQSQVPINERIRHWFRDPEQIGAESVEGYALRSDLGSIKDTFILKAPRDPNNADLLHELFVGLYGTNRLRKVLPNFAYLFGGFQCSAPIIEPRTHFVDGRFVSRSEVNVVSYCELPPHNPALLDRTQVPYVIYENITPALSMKSYVETCNPQEFYNVLWSTTQALRQAWLHLGFVHNDLHFENLLIRRLDKLYSFPYLTRDGIRYITSDLLPTIIDLGRARIRYRGKNYGIKDFESVAIFPDIPLPYLDLYKLFFFSLYAMMEAGNWATLNEVKKLVPFFHPEVNLDQRSLVTFLRKARQTYFYPIQLNPRDQQLFRQAYQNQGVGDYPIQWQQAIRFNYDSFLDYMFSVVGNSHPNITTQPLASLAYCSERSSRYNCGSAKSILNSFFEHPLNHPSSPEDFFEFYDLDTQVAISSRHQERLVESFKQRYPQARDDYLLNLRNDIHSLQSTVNAINFNLRLVDLPYREIKRLAAAYRDSFTQIAKGMSEWKEISFMITIGRYVANIYHDKRLMDDLDHLMDETQPLQLKLRRSLEHLLTDRDYWLNLLRKEQGYNARRNDVYDANIDWLRSTFPQALDLLLD